jgi:hypothetical protein
MYIANLYLFLITFTQKPQNFTQTYLFQIGRPKTCLIIARAVLIIRKFKFTELLAIELYLQGRAVAIPLTWPL